MNLTDAIQYAVEGKSLNQAQAVEIMETVLQGKYTPIQLGAWLSALAAKGEEVEELLGFALVLRERMESINWNKDAVDTCGTGGDYSGSFNVSTAAAIIASSTGVVVSKCGNRAASSLCGSADLLEEAGIRIDLEPEQVNQWLEETGFAFINSRKYSPLTNEISSVRKQISIRTVFNLLGPLCNPVKPNTQLIGVARAHLAELFVEVLKKLGIKRAMVVHGLDGLDEISLNAPTEVHELKNGDIYKYQLNPQDFGFSKAPKNSLKGGGPKENAQILNDLLSGKKGHIRNICVLNTAAALVVAYKAENFKEGIVMAEKALDSGQALDKFESLVKRSI